MQGRPSGGRGRRGRRGNRSAGPRGCSIHFRGCGQAAMAAVSWMRTPGDRVPIFIRFREYTGHSDQGQGVSKQSLTSGAGELVESAPAKLNLGLRLLSLRQDGFHDLIGLFQTVSLADQLRMQPSPRLEVTCSDPNVPSGPGTWPTGPPSCTCGRPAPLPGACTSRRRFRPPPASAAAAPTRPACSGAWTAQPLARSACRGCRRWRSNWAPTFLCSRWRDRPGRGPGGAPAARQVE